MPKLPSSSLPPFFCLQSFCHNCLRLPSAFGYLLFTVTPPSAIPARKTRRTFARSSTLPLTQCPLIFSTTAPPQRAKLSSCSNMLHSAICTLHSSLCNSHMHAHSNSLCPPL